MRAHKYLTFFIITIIGIAGVLFVIPRHEDAPPTTIPAATTTVSTSTTTQPVSETPTPQKPIPTQEVSTAATFAPSTEVAAPTDTTPSVESRSPQQTVTFKIDGASYSVPVRVGEKVIDAMQTAASAGHITFTTREYPGMGLFIDSINGRKNEGGTYWILYINGTSSTVGASSASIGPGDVVEWRYKNSY